MTIIDKKTKRPVGISTSSSVSESRGKAKTPKSSRSAMLRMIMGKLSGARGEKVANAIGKADAEAFRKEWEQIGKEIKEKLEQKG